MIGCGAASGELPLAEARSGRALLQARLPRGEVCPGSGGSLCPGRGPLRLRDPFPGEGLGPSGGETAPGHRLRTFTPKDRRGLNSEINKPPGTK